MPEVLLRSDLSGHGPIHVQVEQGLRDAIRGGRLTREMTLPSTRVLARDLGVSRGVIVEAYGQLTAEGYLVASARSKTVVAAGPAAAHRASPRRIVPSANFDFRPGLPDLSHFPRKAWGRAMRKALRTADSAQLAWNEAQGTWELREALSQYLRRVRGVRVQTGDMIICNGFAQGISLIAQVFHKRGLRRIALEDPCQPDLRRIVADAGLAPVPVPVDEGGLQVEALERLDVRAVVVSPAHQFPTGGVLSPERRHQLAEWSRRRGAFIVEDDYDAEYRYDRSPIGTLQGLAPESVVYAGSLSKILAPALRIGWMIAPPELRQALIDRKKFADLASPVLGQLTFAEFLRTGELDRHLRRMRTVYRQRRDVLLAAIARHLPDWRPQGVAAGLHFLVRLPASMDERDIVRRAADRSIGLYALGDYCARMSQAPALVFGYGGLDENRLAAGIDRLSGCFAAVGSNSASVPK